MVTDVRSNMNKSRHQRQRSSDLETAQHNALNILQQPGQPLDADTRAILEPRFGHSFADVRVHSDHAAARAADEFDARAFAVGQNIVMNTGEYAPNTPQGLSLLTHELTHTIQQRDARGGMPARVNTRSSGAEIEARDTRDRVMRGESAGSISSSADLSVAREDDPTSSNLSDLFGLVGAVTGGGMMGLDPISQTLGAVGNLQKAAGAGSTLETVSALAGAGGNVLGLANFIGSDVMNGGTATVGPGLGAAAGVLGAAQSFGDMVTDWNKGDRFKAIAGDATKGVGGLLSSAGSLLGGATLLGEGGMAGLLSTGSLGAGALLTTEVGALGGAIAGAGAAGGTAAALGTAATVGGAVLGAGAAGVGAGIALDQGTGKLMRGTGLSGVMDRSIDSALNFTGLGGVMDSVGGGSAAAGSRGDYTISDMLARGMTGVDQLATAGMRAVGGYDESRPAYTQTLGWRLAEVLPSWMQ
jgi:hypothetical protein